MAKPIPDPLAATLLCLLTALATVAALAGLARAEETESATLRVLVTAPKSTSDLDEPDDERIERLRSLANAIDAATRSPHERALLVAQARHESGLARFVHLDEPRCSEGHDGWCDSGKSWSVFQLKFTDRTGGDAKAARIAVRRLRYHARRCGFRQLTTDKAVRAAVSGFAVGSGCRWSGADERVATWRSLLRRM